MFFFSKFYSFIIIIIINIIIIIIIILLQKLHSNFVCSHIAQLVEVGRAYLNIK